MNTMDTVIPRENVFDEKRKRAAKQFFTAQVQLVDLTKTMVDNVHAITQDPAHRAALDTLIGQIVAKQAELASLLDSFLPSRSSEQAKYDRKFVRMGHEAENRICDHRHYQFLEHGRHCTCGSLMCDPGD